MEHSDTESVPHAETLERLRELYPGRLGQLLVPIPAREKECVQVGWNAKAMARWEANGDPGPHLDAMARHIETGGNVGWAVPPGALVLDADDDASAAALAAIFDDAPTQETTRGLHVVVRVPLGLELRQRAKLEIADGVHVDLRVARKGYIAAEPSIHPSGFAYSWQRELPLDLDALPEIPAALFQRLPVTAPSAERACTDEPGSTWGEGKRNDRLTSVAGSMRRAGLEPIEIDGALQVVNTQRCHPPLDPSEVSRIAQGMARYERTDVQLTEPQLRRLADIEHRQVEWLWHGKIPLGKVTVLDGNPDVGKSTVTIDLGARVTTARRMPDGSPGIDGVVLFLSAEDDAADTIGPRFEAAGGDPARALILDDSITIPTDVDTLETIVAENAVKLIVIDPLMAFLADDVKTGSDHHVRRSLRPLKGLAERTGAAVVIVRHLVKDSKVTSAILKGGGSIGIIGAARSGLMVARDPDDPERRVLAVSKSNLAPESAKGSLLYRMVSAPNGVGAIEWLGAHDASADEILRPDENTGQEDRASELLERLLTDGPRLTADVEAEGRRAGISARTLRRARKALGIVAEKRFDHRWQLRLEARGPA